MLVKLCFIIYISIIWSSLKCWN